MDDEVGEANEVAMCARAKRVAAPGMAKFRLMVDDAGGCREPGKWMKRRQRMG